MPKKIKKKDGKRFIKKVDENEKIHKTKKVILSITIIGLIVMLSVGFFIFIRDNSYKHSFNPVTRFVYSEGLYNEGYDVYEVEVQTDGIYAFHSMGIESENIVDKWSETRYLNFNEELYDSGALEFNTDEFEKTANDEWTYRLEIYFENGDVFESYSTGKSPKNTEKFIELIKKYFNSDIEL